MKENEKLKLCISYSHHDEGHIKEFIKHIAPLETNGLIDHWYDRKIIAGQTLQKKIDDNFSNADIVCLFISANFLSSPACMEEKNNAVLLTKKKGIAVVYIILSACGWQDDKEIFPLLALPIDGKPISDFPDANNAWHNVYNELKKVIEKYNKIKQLNITEQFLSFLQNTELLAKAHTQKDKVLLEDIFVYPEFVQYDALGKYEKKNSSEKFIANFYDYPKMLIAGEDQSGKTTLCKKIFIELREKNYVPVYIANKDNQDQGKIENKISKAYKEQYETIPIAEIDEKRIIPILDDFHFVKKKEKHIFDLAPYDYQIVVVDDIFSLNIKDENIIKSFTRFKIKEFIPSLRNQLIEKWVYLTEKKDDINHNKNKIYSKIDNTTELVNTALGKVFGAGVMPSYPFFILSMINLYETIGKPLDHEITSQGYCYQALIYMYLRKEGVKTEEIDTYINFLTEFAFFFYTSKKNELSIAEFDEFMKSYFGKYNLPVKQETLLNNLQRTQIIALNNFNNYSFYYPYLYYFFVAKYIAEHIEDNEGNISFIINNLHEDENAYIAIFLCHHSKNIGVLDEIILNACCLFDKYKPATLKKDELNFFDEQVDTIVKAVLPRISITPEKERVKRLEEQDKVEQINGNKNKIIFEEEKSYDDLAMALRRSIKTVEVMGHIIKNRAGSLEKLRIEFIFEEAMKVYLRILTSFFDIIKNDNAQQEIVKYITDRLNVIIEDKERKDKEEKQKPKPPAREKLESLSKMIFWNENFFFVYNVINKIIHSLGSNQLIEIVENVCNKENTPASFLLKHGILMWYNKNVQIDNIIKKIDEDDFSETTKRIMRFMIINHCSIHAIDFKEKQKIEHKLGIPSQKLLIQKDKEIENR